MTSRILMVVVVLCTLTASVSPAHAGVAPAALCKDKKAKATGKKTNDLLKAFGKNAKTPDVVRLGSDISKAQSKFSKAFTKAEFDNAGQPKGCLFTGDAAPVEAEVDLAVVQVLAILDEGGTTTTVTTTTMTTTTTLGGCPPAAVYCDNFNDNSIAGSIWAPGTSGSGSQVNETNQRLEVSHAASAAGSLFGAAYNSVCTLQGDFDMEVDYQLVTWPPTVSGNGSGIRVTLATQGAQSALMERVSFGSATKDFPGQPRNQYVTHFSDGVQGFTPTSDSSGKLRLVRSGTTVTGYRFSGGWIAIDSGPISTADVGFTLSSFSGDPAFTDQAVVIAFDNFVLTQGQLVCPPNCQTVCDTTTTTTAVSTTTTTLASLCGNATIDPGETCEQNSDCSGGAVCEECQCVGSGDVRVTLSWADANDLDLHVIDPNGEEIYYDNPTSASGGTLDVDANPGCVGSTVTPVENVFWPSGSAPSGTYTVLVNYYQNCPGGAATPGFSVETLVDGTETTYAGTATTPDSTCGLCEPATSCQCESVTTFVFP
jgi:hypothetical protein